MCESIGVELAAVVVEPAVFGWVTVRLSRSREAVRVTVARGEMGDSGLSPLLDELACGAGNCGLESHRFGARDSHHPARGRRARRRERDIFALRRLTSGSTPPPRELERVMARRAGGSGRSDGAASGRFGDTPNCAAAQTPEEVTPPNTFTFSPPKHGI